MRENLLKEKHNGGLSGDFEHDKTFAQVVSSYYWPGMREEVKKFVNNYTKHWIVSAIDYSREALGCDKHGFCVGITKNTKRK